MGSEGGSAPNGLTRREARTLFLRVPQRDWTALVQGYKTEFRRPYRGDASSFVVPTPVVIYSNTGAARVLYTKLMVLTEHKVERLLDMDGNEQALMREGFESYAHFRTYWRQRTRRPWRPLAKVDVFTLAPWTPEHRYPLADMLLKRLYGEFMP